MALSSALLMGALPMSSVFANTDSVKVNSVQAQKVWNEKANVPVFVKEKQAEKFTSSTATNALTT